MALIRSPESLKEIEEQYRYGDKGKMSLRSYHLPPYQIEIIDVLAKDTGKSKADVVRDLIDEWCAIQFVRESG